MGLTFITLLPFLLFYVFKGSSSQTVHDVFTYTNKSMEKLECSFTSTILVQWTEQQDNGKAINLFFYDVAGGLAQKQTNDFKYDNFNYSIEGTNGFNLVITNVEKGDKGRYLCNPITSPVVTFDVTVEVLPESISIHCTDLNVCMPSDGRETVPQINCGCMATGLNSSALEIEWEGVDTFTASNTTRDMNSIRSNITLPPPDGTASISCSLTGYRSQVSVRLRSSTYTFSPPECYLVHECPSDGTNASLICSCSKGSPKVNAYIFYDSQKSPIGTQCSSSKSVQVETNKREISYCSGYNGLLHSKIVGDEFNCHQGSAWWIILVILVVVATIIVLVVWKPIKKWFKKRRPKSQDVENRETTEDRGLTEGLLSGNTSGKEYQQVQDPRGIKTVPSGGDPASKKNNKGQGKKTTPSGGDQVSNEDERGKTGINKNAQMKKGPMEKAPKEGEDIGETGLNTEAQTKRTGSKGAPSMKTPKETPKEDKTSGETGLNTEAQTKHTGSKGAPSIKTPKQTPKEDKTRTRRSPPPVPPQSEGQGHGINRGKTGSTEESQSKKVTTGGKESHDAKAAREGAPKEADVMGKQHETNVDNGEIVEEMENDDEKKNKDGTDVDNVGGVGGGGGGGGGGKNQETDHEEEKKDTPPTQERTSGDGEEGAEPAEPMERERTVPHKQGTPASSAALQNYVGRQGGSVVISLPTGHNSQYMNLPSVDTGQC